MNNYRRPRDTRRAGARILDTAEGVLVTLRRCRVDQAFVELMQTPSATESIRSAWPMH